MNIFNIDINLSAVIQIAILYAVFLAILKAARGSRFGQALMGVGILTAVLFAFTYIFEFDVLGAIVRALLVYLAISTVVIFQPEIRRLLAQVGAFGFLEKPKIGPDHRATPEYVRDVVMRFSEKRIGALIAFERGISLSSYENTGVVLNADFSRELMTCIFTPPLPLHDGGVTIRDGRLRAAHCVFPVSNNPELSVSGMRHRAAVGLSEDTDALVIVVSEETGAISVAHNGKLTRYTGNDCGSAILRWITKGMSSEKNTANQLLYRTIYHLSEKFTHKGELK